MRLHLMSHNVQKSGYGRFGLEVRRELERLGVVDAGDLGTSPGDFDGDVLERVALWLSTPPHVRGWWAGQFAAIFTMWESTEIPAGFRDNLHHFDRVYVPSVQNQELFGHVHPDVRFIPLGVSQEWAYSPRPPVEREFRFLTAGYGPRKNCAEVARAFKRLFPKGQPPGKLDPVPRLIIRSRDDISGPGITNLTGDLSARAELNLYADAHAYVSGSMGEGWGLMPAQAIAQGCPTILGDAHGHHAFAHLGIPIDTHPFRCERATFWGDGGYWWEPDFDQMCEAMWELYQNYDAHVPDAAAASFGMHEQFPWSTTAESLAMDLFGEAQAPPVWTPQLPRYWRGAPPRLFHIRVNKSCAWTVNGKVTSFEPGKDYWEAADLKRAVMASGHLDMSTFDPHDVGLEDDANMAELRARNSICPTCHLPFNRNDSLADLIGAIDGD